ncbi:MAG: hypothetical protein M3P84_02900 [Chloroflexota bacterium]|nr:hypothetical protein [Chloroflexota bacterium]
MASPSFSWGSKVRQFRTHLGARVRPNERAALVAWLTPAQLELFDGMHVADRRHGLDVVATLRAGGTTDPELLLAGLLHDCAKGPAVGVLPRVAWSLGQAWGPWVLTAGRRLTRYGRAFDRLRDHAELSARMALAAGCSARTAELIRHQAAPLEPAAGELLRLADEAN